MEFEEVLEQIIILLQRQGRVSYGALKRRFKLDDTYLEDLKVELIEAQQLAYDENGRVLVWAGAPVPTPPPAPEPVLQPSHTSQQPHTQEGQTPPGETAYVARRVPEAERRQLTVMFCDLVDSTALAVQLDPEDLREVVRAYQETSAAMIQRFGGYIAQYLGDGLLVYFGYPQAHEDDAQRAVRTGLGLVAAMGESMRAALRRTGVRLAVRIGIHTGLVVVGEMGGGNRQEQLALGETPDGAAHIPGLATPDTVAISPATFRLVRGYFTCQDLGSHTLKGLAVPLQVYRILGESEAQSRLEVAEASGFTPLVGRESEVALLLERWVQSQDGRGQVVLLRGEARIGKSRLVEALRERARREGATRIAFRCSPYYQNSALYPVIDYLQRFLQWQRDEAPGAKLDSLEQVLRTYRLPLEEVVPLFAALLSVPLPERYPVLNLTPQRQRQKTQEVLVAWLLEEAERQPVLAVWEDLHWADPSTLRLSRPGARPGTYGADADPADVSSGVAPSLEPPGTRVSGHPQPFRAYPDRDHDYPSYGRSDSTGRGGAAGRGEDRWHTPVCRRTRQDDSGVRLHGGGSRPLCADRAAASLGDSLDIARFTDGPARPAVSGQRTGAARRRPGAGVCLRIAPGRLATG